MSSLTQPPAIEQVMKSLEEQPDLLQNNWCVPRETGRFLHVMALTIGAKRICEVGTSIGYSTLWLAKAAASFGGRVDTIEYFETRQKQAISNVEAANLADAVRFHLGKAVEVLEQFRQAGRQFDLAFIDAAKKEYLDYARLLESMLVSGGLLIADNTQSNRAEMEDFIRYIEQSPCFDVAEILTPNGQLVARKR